MRRLSLFLVFATHLAFAQESEKVMEPVRTLFIGMEKADSALVHSVFYAVPSFSTVFVDEKTSQPVIKGGRFQDFLKAVGTPHAEPWHEVIWSPKIEIDGNMAQVWAPYAFYSGKKFSHCGVDAFHLFKDASGKWRIFNLADTRQKAGCQVPEEVASRFK